MTEQNGVERSSATEELLAGLTQRGVKYTNIGDLTFWLDESGVKWCAQEQPGSELHLQAITFLNPEQAIAATLGRDTCHPLPIYSFDGEFIEYDCDACSKCGDEWEGDRPNFCPNCGAKVVSE